MRLTTLPLRILLAVALVINTIGGAMAGVGGPAGPTPSLHDSAITADCGGHAPEHPAVPARDASGDGHPCPSTGEDDCSDDAQCLQACTHACVALAQRVQVGVHVNAAMPLHRITRGHPSPPARSPIRPPIA